MAFLTYEQVRPYAKAIKADILQNKMPPWPADPHSVKFSNDRSLTPAEVQTISAWVDSGAKEGDKTDAPAPRTWVEGWNISKPDAVIQMPIAFEVPAKGEIEYQSIVVTSGFTEVKWVQQVEVRSSDRTVFHHAGLFASPLEVDGRRQTGRCVRAMNLPSTRFANCWREQRPALRLHARHGSDIYKPARQTDQGRYRFRYSDALHRQRKSGQDQTSTIVFARESHGRIVTTAAITTASRFRRATEISRRPSCRW
jgi:hypothetical protein